ncbi:MAG: acyltransferase [Actinobacteria bacterium]|nr:acyltransferase [Actinomycetota bacterium]
MAVTQQRADIQGLRALAVLLVVAGHLFPTAVKGGFVGVDVFFVISGFVITQQMLKSYLESEQQFLLRFYARRVRRILPSAILVTIVSIWATRKYLGPVAANNATLDGGWTTVFLGNFHFHNTAFDYFAAGTQPSPLQHYWSLSIEEQFYLLWPALFILLYFKPISLKMKQCVIGTIISLSILTALYQSSVAVAPIFFSTWTRMWELGAGALLAITPKTFQIPKVINYGMLGFLLTSAFIVEQSMQWPRVTTIPIVLATSILLLRNPRLGSFRLLENKLAVYIGNLSYIIYLWHWPVLTIVKSYYSMLGTQQILLVIGLTAVLSVLTHHLFENPIRYSQVLSRRPVLAVSTGAIAIASTATTLFTNYQG